MISPAAGSDAAGLEANPMPSMPRSASNRRAIPVSSSVAPGLELENKHSAWAATFCRTPR